VARGEIKAPRGAGVWEGATWTACGPGGRGAGADAKAIGAGTRARRRSFNLGYSGHEFLSKIELKCTK
jgi:hypothetical protein